MLATVATSGSYSDLSSQPTIPTRLDELSGDIDTTTLKQEGYILKWVYISGTYKWMPRELSAADVRQILGIVSASSDTNAGSSGVATGELYFNSFDNAYVLKQ